MPWIKNTNIKPFKIYDNDEFIIYSNKIQNEKDYLNALSYISYYRDRLLKRRECALGRRKWYELEWGRDLSIFENKKIVFPYKASTNNFAIDEGHCFSADVYCIKIMGFYENLFSYEFLVGLLNSSLYEFYIKSIAKKLGNDMYDYYPNKIMTLKIPKFIPEIDQLVKLNKPNLKQEVDSILNNYYKISDEELKIINSWCSPPN